MSDDPSLDPGDDRYNYWKDRLERVTRQRDMWHRLFNRLDAAITHHFNATFNGFTETHDEALYAARKRIYADAAEEGRRERERDSR